jgi:hypothetical protein
VTRPFPFVTLSFQTLLFALLAIDCAFIAANVLAVLAVDLSLTDHVPIWLKITEDREPPEDFNYLKWLVIIVALGWMAIRDRWLAPALWALVFALILADDAFQIHENMGESLAGVLGAFDSALLSARDLGEMLVFGTLGTIAVSIALLLYLRNDPPSRRMNQTYVLVMIALGIFGVGMDALHAMIEHVTGSSGLATALQQFLGMVEDGGEMLVGSYAVAATLAPQSVEWQA